jgi:hypothetical protein
VKIVYSVLVVLYGLFFWWYGGFASAVSEQELESYIEEFETASHAQGIDPSEPIKYMRNLAASDQGGEFLMVNLMDFRDAAAYPPESPWADDPDPLAANARYTEKMAPLLLKRASHPMLLGPLTGTFIIEGHWGNWDSLAIVRYRSARDMIEMMIEMAALGDVAVHKWASMEKTQVFPIKQSLGFPGMRLLVALLLIALAIGARCATSFIKSK